MKKVIKSFCALSLLVIFATTASAAGMIKDYHAYRLKDQNIRTVVPVVDNILSREVEVKKLARISNPKVCQNVKVGNPKILGIR